MAIVVGEQHGDQRTSATSTDQPYLIVSGDSHAGPSLEKQLRDYCPKKYLDEFDAYAKQVREGEVQELRHIAKVADQSEKGTDTSGMSEETRQDGLAKVRRVRTNPGSMFTDARLADMDADGVTAELIFAGAQNAEVLPWAGGFDAGAPDIDGDLRAIGNHIWNEWLADFVAPAPERLLGAAQIPVWDIDAAVKEVHWAKEHGLRAINFPAPRPDYPWFNQEQYYAPLWAAVEECDLPLVTHSSSGGEPLHADGRGAMMIWLSEVLWHSRRGLGQMIYGGVFDRHPNLRLAFVEQRGNWVQHALNELDSAYYGAPVNAALPLLGVDVDAPKKSPTEYWNSNCFIADSFMAPYEVAMRDEIGIDTLVWGSDYPHLEGTWPHTKAALRFAFADVPEADTRKILGENGIRLFNLDVDKLQPVADRIGPRPSELAQPLQPSEFPPYKGLAFRHHGSFH